MSFVVVPNSLRDAINAKLDEALKDVPEATLDREVLYAQLFDYFDKYGVVPEFSLEKKSITERNE